MSAKAQAQADALKAERNAIADKLEFLDREVKKNDVAPMTPDIVDSYIEETDHWRNELDKIHKQIRILKPADEDDHKYDYFILLESIRQVSVGLRSIRANFPVSSSGFTAGPTYTSARNPGVKLPTLEIPVFHGDFLEWTTFRDTFEAAIDKNPSLSKVQKFSYLRSFLKGEAARCTAELPLTDANYEIAWRQLQSRYQNKRKIAMAAVERFFAQTTSNGTPKSIRAIVDATKRCQLSLETLGYTKEEAYEIFYIYQMSCRLDFHAKDLWEHSLPDTKMPKLNIFCEFLERHANALEERGSVQNPDKQVKQFERKTYVHLTNTSNNRERSKFGNQPFRNQTPGTRPQNNTFRKCSLGCGEGHKLFLCKKFTAMSVEERHAFVRKEKRCVNCLRIGHSSQTCPATYNCRKCDRPHNTLLHYENRNGYNWKTKEEEMPIILVKDQFNNYQKCKVLLDNAASDNFITTACVNKLNLQKSKTHVQINGLGESSLGNATGKASFTFSSLYNKQSKFSIDAFIVPKISNLPQCKIRSTQILQNFSDLELADPNYNKPSEIEILIGAELFYELIQGEKKLSNPNGPVAINSALGWLIGGGRNQTSKIQASIQPILANTNNVHHTVGTDQNLDKLISNFWEIESIPTTKLFSKEEQNCEELFERTYTRNEKGQFIVRYPFKVNPAKKLGESLPIAIRRLRQVERRITTNPQHQAEYKKFMNEYLSLGHMVEVEPPTAASKFRCYIPHHFVVKESSTTTKFRVVFDASAKTSNGVSLNDTMMVGPQLQDSLASLIMRFRTHNVAITADIEKMYRQVLIHPDDQEFQHIVWREDPSKPLRHFKLLTVTYGTAGGPYLATKSIKVLADIEKVKYPVAAKVLKNDFFMDDCLSGAKSVEKAIKLQQELRALLLLGGFSIRKFTSNSEKVLQAIPEECRETKSLSLLEKDATIKTLGIYWNPADDSFGFKTSNIANSTGPLTKRKILSEIAKLFDPIGWISPVIISAKILMQLIWKEKVDWDDAVPDHIISQWEVFKTELPKLEKVKIPRCYSNQIGDPDTKTFLVGFSDASIKAYSAVVYLCTYGKLGAEIALVTSKTRVAPVQTISLAKLELSGSLLVSELMTPVAEALKLQYDGKFAYTDSTIALGWVRSEPYKYQTFVSNRIAKVQEHLPSELWGFVQGTNNPADCASRGITVDEFIQHPLWWKATNWLRDGIPTTREPLQPIIEPEDERRATVVHTTSRPSIDLFEKFSSLVKLQRITAFILRFIYNMKASVQKRKSLRNHTITYHSTQSTWLTTREVHYALIKLIQIAQQEEFKTEISLLEEKKPLHRHSKILSLTPFLDNKQILRVGGRLRNADIPVDKKFPILLPRYHRLTYLIIQDAHISNMHAGPQTLLSCLQQRYWIVRAKDLVRNVISKCVICTRFKAATMTQLMGNLPSYRVNPAKPFQKCGLDYAGPLQYKPMLPRSKVTLKAYIAIFVCCATRAIHLELVSDATSEAFLAALKRFIARRGIPTDIYSDNGKNFEGADNELKKLKELANSQKHNEKVTNQLSAKGINWHFNPPAAPHFGGLWEAGVKSTKYHLRRIMGNYRFTFEELNTALIQIEAILNSRPLTPESNNPTDFRALTPSHFLIGQPLNSIPEPDLTEIPINRLVRWQLIQQIMQHFWKRWSEEYISRLQQRPKWLQLTENIAVGNMVILKDENAPPMNWKLGRVTQIHPGKDGHVRAVTVKTQESEFKRPVVKLCLLPIENALVNDTTINPDQNV